VEIGKRARSSRAEHFGGPSRALAVHGSMARWLDGSYVGMSTRSKEVEVVTKETRDMEDIQAGEIDECV
jgi:hypothetical protein